MNTGSLTYTCSPDPGGWGTSWSAFNVANDQVILSHTAFAYGTTYTFTITVASDIAGNALATPISWSFTTIAAASATATGPTGGPTNVVGVTITYTYTGAPTSVNLYYTKSIVSPWTWVLAGNDATVDGSFAYTIIAGSGNYRWYASAVGGGSTESSPPTILMVPESGSYILDLAAPTLTVTNPANSAIGVATTQSVVITFSEAMSTGTVAYTCAPDPGGWIPSWNGPTNTILTLTHTAFAYGTTYTFTVTGGTDVAGNALVAGAIPNPWTFTTLAAASATATGPTGGPTNVAGIAITYTWTGVPTSVNLYYTTNGGTSWTLAGTDATVDGSFAWTVPASGTY